MNSLRGSGRTYREMEKMCDYIIGSYNDNPFNIIFYFSPTAHLSRHNFNEFMRKHLSPRINTLRWTPVSDDRIVFGNGTTVFFKSTNQDVNGYGISYYTLLRGIDNALIFEDHTLYERHS